MKKAMFLLLAVIFTVTVFSQDRFSSRDISINGFRNPSIGLEFRYHHVSFHGGYYLTSFEPGETTQFFKTGITFWFLAVDKKGIPSSFYAGASYMRGLNRYYEGKNALGLEAGFRWMIWKGINFRIGGIALAAKGKDVKINPTPGISYTFKF